MALTCTVAVCKDDMQRPRGTKGLLHLKHSIQLRGGVKEVCILHASDEHCWLRYTHSALL